MVNKRIEGLDFARGVAVWGMILMNFKIVMTEDRSGILGVAAHFMEGHYGVMFVVLAGMGISLFMKKAVKTENGELLKAKRVTLFKRSAFLMVIGLLFSFIWPADILHYYGFYIMIGAMVAHLSNKKLWILSGVFTLIFPLLLLFASYESGWDFSNLSYVDFWTVKGFIRNTFFNGFHPVFPWISFLFIGLIFGRIEFSKSNLKRLFVISLIVAICVEVLAHILVSSTRGEVQYLFSRDAMPPGPLFVIASAAEAVVMIIIAMYLYELVKGSFIVKPLVYTGQMVLSHYIIHVFIGLGILDAIGKMRGQTLGFSLAYATIYFAFSVVFSFLWGVKFKRGPFELLMRKISG